MPSMPYALSPLPSRLLPYRRFLAQPSRCRLAARVDPAETNETDVCCWGSTGDGAEAALAGTGAGHPQ
jgi:hypothetical protein